MKAIVTGSKGFIGAHLISFLKYKKIEVFSLPHKILQNFTQLSTELKNIEPDYIFHFAAYGNHSHQNDIEEIFNGNIVSTFNLLNSVKNLPFKAFINVGSSSEYGKKSMPMVETDFLETDTLYGASKVSTTYLSRAFAIQFDKPIVTIRPFSVYGGGEAKARFIPRIIRCLITGKAIDIVPEPKHDWIYIDDFLAGVFAVVENISRLKGEVINIGTGQQYSNIKIVKQLEHISNKKLKMNMLRQMREYDTINWVASNIKLQELDWQQQYDLTEGLKLTYDYYSKQRS